MQRISQGYAAALAATVIWSGNFVVARAVADMIPPWQCNFWRWLVALLALLPFAWKHLAADWPQIRAHARYLTVQAILGVTLMNTLIYKAGQTTESLNMALLVPTAPVVILLLSRILYGETISPRRLLGVCLVVAGVVILVSRGDWERLAALRLNSGDFWALGGALCFGLYSLFMRRRPAGISAFGFNAALFALGLLCALPFTLAEAVLLPLPQATTLVVVSVLYTGIGCSFLSFWLWTLAIDRIGPVRAGIVYYSLPVFAAAASVVILGEAIVRAQIVGGALVIGGILAATLHAPGAEAGHNPGPQKTSPGSSTETSLPNAIPCSKGTLMNESMTVILASRNAGKIRELGELLSGYGIQVLGLDAFPGIGEIEETGTTFEENALLKARTVAQLTGHIAIADDSGLEVDALDGAPGVYSARYGDDWHSLDGESRDQRNMRKLLLSLSKLPEAPRNCRFVCCMAAVKPDFLGGGELVVRGTWEGSILDEPRGQNGFGYDPVFFDPELGKAAAELSGPEKNARSHRGKALRLLMERWSAFAGQE